MKAKEDQGQTGGRSPPFVCRIARFAHSSSSLSSYLALLAPGDLAYPRALLCRCPPLYSLFTYFCLAGIYSENDGSTSLPPPNNFFPPHRLPFHPMHIFRPLYPSLPGLFSLISFPLSQNGCCGRALLRFVCRFRHEPFSGAPLVHALHICRALFVPNLCYSHGYHGYSQQGPLTQ